jgi:hypothetical protein
VVVNFPTSSIILRGTWGRPTGGKKHVSNPGSSLFLEMVIEGRIMCYGDMYSRSIEDHDDLTGDIFMR